MKLISCHDGKLHALDAGAPALRASPGGRAFVTGLPALDALAPGGAFARGAVHELLWALADGQPLFLATLLARASCGTDTLGTGSIIWCDPEGELYPPALAAHGISLDRLFLLHPTDGADRAGQIVWAVAESLRCKGVSAVVAAPPRLSRTEARRLQLSAERGGGVGLLLRPCRPKPPPEFAAATRWLVAPAPGERTVQRWRVELVHGHGGRVGGAVFLEHHRETNSVRAVERLADHGGSEKVGAGAARASA